MFYQKPHCNQKGGSGSSIVLGSNVSSSHTAISTKIASKVWLPLTKSWHSLPTPVPPYHSLLSGPTIKLRELRDSYAHLHG